MAGRRLSSNSARLAYLDGMRGMAALYVVAHHAYLEVRPHVFDALGPLGRYLTDWLGYGHIGVGVFIVLSGYCLMLTAETDLSVRGSLYRYGVRRARRILPPYFGALLLSLALVTFVPHMNETRNSRWDLALPADSAGALWSHIFLVHNLFDSWRYKINPPLWSVALEWQLYFLLPLVVIPVWRKVGPWGVVVFGFLAGYGAHVLFNLKNEAYLWYFFLFVLGAVAGRESQRSPNGSYVYRVSGLLLWLSAGVLALSMLLSPFLSAWRWLWEHEYVLDFLIGIAVSSFLLRESCAAHSGKEMSLAARMLSSRCLVFLGAFSYSLYLIHYPLLSWLHLHLAELQLSPHVLLLNQIGCGVLVSVSFSYLFYCVVEVPFMSAHFARLQRLALVMAGVVVGAFAVFVALGRDSITPPAFYLSTPHVPPSEYGVQVRGAEAKPVLMRGDKGTWDSVDVLNPSVVEWGGKLWNFYSGFDGSVWRTGVATSHDGKSWTKYQNNPVLSPGSGGWDARYIAANGSAIVVDEQLRYYFAAQSVEGITSIGLAVSNDGYGMRKSALPVLSPGLAGQWDEHTVSDPYVIRDGGSFYMYFLGMNRVGVQRLGVAKSSDGIHWSKHPGNPIMDIGSRGDFDVGGLGEPSVIKVGNLFLMAYTGRALSEQRTVGFAASADGVNWRKLTPDGVAPSLIVSDWNSKVLCDTTFLQGDQSDVVRVWYGGGSRADPAQNIEGDIGYFEVQVPRWAWKGFDPSDVSGFGGIPTTDIVRGSFPIESSGTCWVGQEGTMFLDRGDERRVGFKGYVPYNRLVTRKHTAEKVSILFLANGKQFGSLEVFEDTLVDTTLELPDWLPRGPFAFTFRVSHTFSPASSSGGEDFRQLGMVLQSVSLK